jgi:hypothetical protein
VEVRFRSDEVDVRDSKHQTGAFLTFTLGEWQAFVSGVAAGEFSPEDAEEGDA